MAFLNLIRTIYEKDRENADCFKIEMSLSDRFSSFYQQLIYYENDQEWNKRRCLLKRGRKQISDK